MTKRSDTICFVSGPKARDIGLLLLERTRKIRDIVSFMLDDLILGGMTMENATRHVEEDRLGELDLSALHEDGRWTPSEIGSLVSVKQAPKSVQDVDRWSVALPALRPLLGIDARWQVPSSPSVAEERWGTCRDAVNSNIAFPGAADDSFTMHLATSGNPPVPALQAFCKEFPDLVVHGISHDENLGNAIAFHAANIEFSIVDAQPEGSEERVERTGADEAFEAKLDWIRRTRLLAMLKKLSFEIPAMIEAGSPRVRRPEPLQDELEVSATRNGSSIPLPV